MTRNNEYGMTIRDAFDAMRRQKKTAVNTFFAIIGLAVAAAILWPPTYRSEGKLFVRPTAKHITQDPTVTKHQMVSVAPPAEQDVNSIVEILLSREMAQRVVNKVGVENFSGFQSFEKTGNADNNLLTEKHEKAVSTVMDKLSISSPEKTTIIDIAYDADSPDVAQQVVDVVMNEYLSEHISVNQTDGSYEFFHAQTEKLKKELDASSDRLKSLKNKFELATIAGKRKMLEQQIADAGEQSLLAQYTEKHPRVIAAKRQVQSGLDELKLLNTHELDVLQLEREVSQAEASYHTYLERLEQARMHDELEGSRISNVQIVQHATYVSKPVAPRKSLILALAIVVATGSSIGIALLKDMMTSCPAPPVSAAKSCVEITEPTTLLPKVTVFQTHTHQQTWPINA